MFSFRSYFKLGDTSYLDIGKGAWKRAKDDDCGTYAAAIAYYLLFALFPFFLFLTTLLGYVPVPALLDNILAAMQTMMPGEAFNLVADNIKALFANKQGGLMSFGFLLALWTSSNAVTCLMNVMNRLYEVPEGRPFWKVRLIAVFLVAALAVLLIMSLVLIMTGPNIANWILGLFRMGEFEDWVWYLIMAPVVLFSLMVALALVYYLTPDVKQSWRWITPGSFLVIPVWLLTSIGFSFYVNNFGSYNKTYGSIGAVIVLLLWLYISSYIALMGAEVNSEIEFRSPEGKEPGEKAPQQREREPGKVERQRRESP